MRCTRCGADTPAGAKFCPNCAAPMPAPPVGVSTGGGAYVGGNARAGRDFVGRDQLHRKVQHDEWRTVHHNCDRGDVDQLHQHRPDERHALLLRGDRCQRVGSERELERGVGIGRQVDH